MESEQRRSQGEGGVRGGGGGGGVGGRGGWGGEGGWVGLRHPGYTYNYKYTDLQSP